VSHQEQVSYDCFYRGLLISDNNAEKVRLFESALSNPNEFVRNAASERLAILMLQGVELSANTISAVHQQAGGFWASVFEIIASLENNTVAGNRDKALSFLLNVEHNSESFDHARLYLLGELKKNELHFSETEMAAIEGHHAVVKLRYNDALRFFRTFQGSGATSGFWPSQIPDLFLEFPNLINDLGRAFQYTSTGSEGLNLFLGWESGLQGECDDIRFRLVFYAARIARRMGGGNIANAVSLFERALVLSPDYEQQDACIWYILDALVSGPTSVFYEQLERFIPYWHNDNYFSGILERYIVRLVTGREWRRVINVFNLLKDTNAAMKAGYAWLVARALEEGYLTAGDRQLAARAARVDNASLGSLVFYRIAYDVDETMTLPVLYYRMQSAKALGLPLLILPEENVEPDEDTETELQETHSFALEFLLGFFSNDAVGLSIPYIRQMENMLTPEELRIVAQALYDAHVYPQSMRLASLNISREDYIKDRRDYELMFPRPYLELIETNAMQFEIAPSLLFALIRAESAFQSAVVSRAGAVGLSQLMPATALEQAERIKRRGGPDFLGPDNIVDSANPYANVYIGSYYYNFLLSRFDNNEQLALMSYNGGQTRVRRWFNAGNLPADLLVETVTIFETRDYGRRVPAFGRIYEELYYGN